MTADSLARETLNREAHTMKSHGDYMQFDTTTETGRRELLDALASDAVEIAEGIEPLRDPRFRKKGD